MDLSDTIDHVLGGGCAVVNIRSGDTRVTYGPLLSWADDNDRYLYVGRFVRRAGTNPFMCGPYDWRNPYVLGRDGTREEILARFEDDYLPTRPDLLQRLPERRGKVLGCWCAPEPCHADILARLANA